MAILFFLAYLGLLKPLCVRGTSCHKTPSLETVATPLQQAAGIQTSHMTTRCLDGVNMVSMSHVPLVVDVH